MTGQNQPQEAATPAADDVEGDAQTAEAPAETPVSEASDAPIETASVVVADDEFVRTGVSSVQRDGLPGFVRAHAQSPLAWAELADIAHSEGREIDAYAYATVAHQRGLELLADTDWATGDPISWAHAPNQAVLRAAYALRRAASAIGLVYEADALTAFLESADPDAIARIESEHTATQLITVVPPAFTAPAVLPVTEAFVIRGED